MRADRLVAALLLMQSRGRVTAAELARELEVSVATARRDLEALSAAGIPAYPQPGRGHRRTVRTELARIGAALTGLYRYDRDQAGQPGHRSEKPENAR